jgi:cytosine/adenosine deaminase-related metal-dependent hydrolase
VRCYHAAWVVPIARAPIADGTVAVEGLRIAYVGPRADAPQGEDIELGQSILMPGLVNAHTHLELTGMRGVLEGLSFVPWIRTLTQMRAAVLTDADMADAARVGVLEGLLAGITTFGDTSSSGTTLGVMGEMGVRGIMYQEVFGPAAEQHDAALAGLQGAIAARRPLETSLVSLGVSPHAPYTVHDDLMVDATAFALRERLPVAIHLAESAEEIAFLREGEGPFAEHLRSRGIPVVRRAYSPVHWLVEMGVLVAQPLLIHCVRVEESDISFIADAGCGVAHCPASNAKFGHGVAPVRAMLRAGISVGLGSDSVASNNQMDLLGEARLAALFQNAVGGAADALTAERALELATRGGARALGLEDRVGTLEVGKEADLAAFPLDVARGVPTTDPVAAAVFALPGTAARLTCVAGRELVRDGRIVTGWDTAVTDRVAQRANAMALWRKGH